MPDTAEDGIVTVNGVEHEPTDRRSSTLQQLPDHQNQSSHFSYIMIHRLISDNLHDVQGYIFAFPLGLNIRLVGSSEPFKSVVECRICASDALFPSRRRCLWRRRFQGCRRQPRERRKQKHTTMFGTVPTRHYPPLELDKVQEP